MRGGGELRAQALVIGAGPAGCSAAMTLAAGGADVAILDEGRFPRGKVCGDGLSPRCMALLAEMGLQDLAARAYQATIAHVVAPNGRSVSLPTGRIGALMRRAEFDAALLHRARAGGARLFPDAKVVEVRCGPQGIEAQTAQGRAFRADWGVCATGAGQQGLRACGLPRRPAAPEAIGRRAYFEGAGLPPGAILLDFSRELLPAYGWVFALGDGAANVGVMTFLRPGRRKASPLTERFVDFVHNAPACRRFLSHACQAGPAASAPLRMGFGTGLPARGRLLIAGDAADAADPMTGEGIRAALLTGRLAADCILRALSGQEDPERAAEGYRAAVRRAFARDCAHARLTRRLMAHAAAPNRFVSAARRHPDLAETLVRVILEGASPLEFLRPASLLRLLM